MRMRLLVLATKRFEPSTMVCARARPVRPSASQSVSGPIGTQEIMVRTWQKIGRFTL